jgi:Na+-transporting NADH:ubiquinone oxidoreductase subunit C
MVIIVAIALTFIAVLLKPKQQYNIKVEKMQNILASANIESTVDNAEELYKKHIKETFVINNKGEMISNTDAFGIDLYMELKKPVEKRNLPVFVCVKEKDEHLIIVPIRGKGLWGPIWGYVAFNKDLNTIEGAIFDHKGETPGLGSEINTQAFSSQFFGKSIFNDEGKFVSIEVIKGGASPENKHGVDAISGGTITSKGLEKMLYDCLEPYVAYFKANHQN